ncbi:hypothetical protein E2C01_017203 [Portunus trituberculatus]|uniref:Uncharacterized protein n=1 Tax=Portunus trituberculatus TaxID=210409 RepID=A0A5B7DRA5_PORTR|nr:hypothetical protein [Portunus trituberculatus]
MVVVAAVVEQIFIPQFTPLTIVQTHKKVDMYTPNPYGVPAVTYTAPAPVMAPAQSVVMAAPHPPPVVIQQGLPPVQVVTVQAAAPPVTYSAAPAMGAQGTTVVVTNCLPQKPRPQLSPKTKKSGFLASLLS